jgi:hypothetical protein
MTQVGGLMVNTTVVTMVTGYCSVVLVCGAMLGYVLMVYPSDALVGMVCILGLSGVEADRMDRFEASGVEGFVASVVGCNRVSETW